MKIAVMGKGGSGKTTTSGVLTAIAAFYTSFAGVTNATFGRVVLPVWPLPAGLLPIDRAR